MPRYAHDSHFISICLRDDPHSPRSAIGAALLIDMFERRGDVLAELTKAA
jgi:hypothetical protein